MALISVVFVATAFFSGAFTLGLPTDLTAARALAAGAALAFLAAVAVFGLAFAATLFTEAFGAWLLPDRAEAVGGVLRFVAAAAFAVGLATFRAAGRAEATRAELFRAAGALPGVAALVFAGARDFGACDFVVRSLAVGADFLLALVAAVAALVVAAFVLGGMALRTL